VLPGKPVDANQLDKEVNWVCQFCDQPWDQDDDSLWIVCHIYDTAFHLECCGLMYKRNQYYEIDIANLDFACDDCFLNTFIKTAI
jgi:hypothetical protein